MAIETQSRKWFIFVEDRHQGPFSEDDLRLKVALGALAETDPVWSAGMADWESFADAIDSRARPDVAGPAVPVELTPEFRIRRVVEAEAPPPARRLSRTTLIAAATFVGAGAAIAWLGPVHYGAPAWQPSPSELPAEDLAQLRSAVASPLRSAGPKVAIAATRAGEPYVIVATNLPDGARFLLQLNGVADTLLDHTAVAAHAEVVAQGGFARTPAFRLTSSQPLPRGEYRVQVSAIDAREQPANVSRFITRPVAGEQSAFLGGPRDAEYDRRLRAYHAELRAKAEAELAELHQFAGFLEDQLHASASEFQKTTLARRAGKQPGWAAFDAGWTRTEGQLDAAFLRWKPESAGSHLFYNMLYLQTQQAGALVARAHALEAKAIGSIDPALEVQAAETSSLAQSTILSLRSRLALAQSLPPTPNGMPRRDGL